MTTTEKYDPTTFETLVRRTANGTCPRAPSTVSCATGGYISPATVKDMAAKGQAWLEAEAAKVKAAAISEAKRKVLLVAARGAWLIARAQGLK